MDYVKFGKTGLDVSRLCIGCMTYGIPGRGPHPWTLDEEKSRPLIKQALDAFGDIGIARRDTGGQTNGIAAGAAGYVTHACASISWDCRRLATLAG